MIHARDSIKVTDFDPSVLLWSLRRRANLAALPKGRVVVRFEFSGVPPSHTKFRIMWLLLERSGVDVCAKDPGFAADLVFRGAIPDLVAVVLGHALWRDFAGRQLVIEGKRQLAKGLPVWLRLDKVLGKDIPLVRQAA